jgi:hypothetical protein
MVKNGDLRSQNDNSREYRESRSKQTEKLLKRALSYIHESDKNFSQKNICITMDILAEEEDIRLNAVIKPSAISKNNHYKAIISAYKNNNNIIENKKKSNLTEVDLAFELHKCKTFLAQKTDEVIILEDILRKEGIETSDNFITIEKEDFDYKNLLKQAYSLMIDDGLAFLKDENLVLENDITKVIANKKLLLEIGLL